MNKEKLIKELEEAKASIEKALKTLKKPYSPIHWSFDVGDVVEEEDLNVEVPTMGRKDTLNHVAPSLEGEERVSREDVRDVFFPLIKGRYRAACLYNGVVAPKCPNNDHSLCRTELLERPRSLYHDWDGKNAWKCPCG